MLSIEEAAKILQNPKDYWSHQVAEAHDTADAVVIALATINGTYLSVSRELLNTYLKQSEERRLELCGMTTTSTTESM